jgi:hypothetical protein
MLQVVQAFDRVSFAELPVDDIYAIEAKLQAALRVLGDRGAAQGRQRRRRHSLHDV